MSRAATLTVTPTPAALGAAVIAAGERFLARRRRRRHGRIRGAATDRRARQRPADRQQLVAAPIATLAGVRSVSAGNAGVAVKADGTAWAFGYRGYIDCSAGATAETPVQIAGAANIVAASVGDDHTLLLDRDGVVHAFGCNDQGELGRPIGAVAFGSPAAPVQGLPGPPRNRRDRGRRRLLARARRPRLRLGLGRGRRARRRLRRSAGRRARRRCRCTASPASSRSPPAPTTRWPCAATASSPPGAPTTAASSATARRSTDRLPDSTLLTSGITAIAAGGVDLARGAHRRHGAVVGPQHLRPARHRHRRRRSPGRRRRRSPASPTAVAVAVGTGRGHAWPCSRDGTLRAWGNNDGSSATARRRAAPIDDRPASTASGARLLGVSDLPLTPRRATIEFNGAPLDAAGWQTLAPDRGAISAPCPTGATGTTRRAAAPASGAGRPRPTSAPAWPSAARLPAAASGGGDGTVTGVFVNGRELHPIDVQGLSTVLPVKRGRYWWDAAGNVGVEGGPALFNFYWIVEQQRQAAGQTSTTGDCGRGESTFVGHGCAAVHGRLRASDEGSSYSYYVGC